MRRWPATSSLLLLALPFLGFSAGAAGPDTPEAKVGPEEHHQVASHFVGQFLTRVHYAKRPIDDRLAVEWFDAYLDDLDPQRLFFLAGDVADFQARARGMDDDLRSEKPRLDLAFDMFVRYRQRAREAYALSKQVAEGEIRFDDSAASMELDRSDAVYPADAAAREALWRDRVTSQLLDMVLRGESLDEARARFLKRTERSVARLDQMDNRDVVEVYLSALAGVYDPHSSYFKPSSSEDFDIRMRDALEGIGAELRFEDGKTKIVRLIAGGPAAGSGELGKGDLIVAVAQGDADPVDVVEMRLEDVVQLIRGKKGTEVRLTIQPAANPTMPKIVSLIRDRVVLERVSAKAKMREIPRDGKAAMKVGVIDVPSFYLDSWAARQGAKDIRSSTNDVRKHLLRLQSEGAEAMVIDLRGNGGGALSEAISLTGLFIDKGPVVQIHDPQDGLDILEDTDRGVVWSGPLVVLTDELSASASEIFAGAIQDHGRGIVVGASQTHGKGTVQQMLDIGRVLRGPEYADIAPKAGALKLTVQKFYRIDGGSTQRMGVQPDIVLPSPWEGIDVLEADLDGALPYDAVKPAVYTPLPMELDRDAIRSASAARVASNPVFGWLAEDVAERKRRESEDRLSLHQPTRETEMKEALDRTNARRKVVGLDAIVLGEDLSDDPPDEPAGDDTIEDLGDAIDAAILDEALAITADFAGRWTPPPELVAAERGVRRVQKGR